MVDVDHWQLMIDIDHDDGDSYSQWWPVFICYGGLIVW